MSSVLSRGRYRHGDPLVWSHLLLLRVRNRGSDRLRDLRGRGARRGAGAGALPGERVSQAPPPRAAAQRAGCHLRAGLHQRRAHLVHGQLHHHGGPPAGHPASPVPGGAADIPVHHPGGGHHHGALCHRRTPGARRQAQRGGGRHGVLHVLPQLAPLSGRCRDRTTRASALRPDGTVDILPTLGIGQNHGCVGSGGLFRLPTATASLGSGAPAQL
ncbi:unnamed protein product [Gulo gulo]|uniref:Uncharacterized protein n=1 Tax=Gulo gulo TaxID=48420 RepID=A0A9X9M830_GULGU|nr:unnamed protein product [Gulo gulo]